MSKFPRTGCSGLSQKPHPQVSRWETRVCDMGHGSTVAPKLRGAAVTVPKWVMGVLTSRTYWPSVIFNMASPLSIPSFSRTQHPFFLQRSMSLRNMVTLLPFPPTAAQEAHERNQVQSPQTYRSHANRTVMLEMGQHGNALIACREAVRDLENVDSELMRISRMPAEHACASCGCLMASQSKGLSKAIGK
jgi:hypothetical protein